MPKFELTVRRTETYEDTIEVEAETEAEAIENTNKLLQTEGWDELFPDDGEYIECYSEVIDPKLTKDQPHKQAEFVIDEYDLESGPSAPVNITVKQNTPMGMLQIGVEGHGLCGMHDAMNDVIVLEKYQGKVRLVIWPDINEEDATVIDFGNALASKRVE
jgi:hypothetical protein